jgi:hypothetical protein
MGSRPRSGLSSQIVGQSHTGTSSSSVQEFHEAWTRDRWDQEKVEKLTTYKVLDAYACVFVLLDLYIVLVVHGLYPVLVYIFGPNTHILNQCYSQHGIQRQKQGLLLPFPNCSSYDAYWLCTASQSAHLAWWHSSSCPLAGVHPTTATTRLSALTRPPTRL